MPSTSYRRKLRSAITNSTTPTIYLYNSDFILPPVVPPVTPTPPPHIVETEKKICDIDKLRNHFYRVLEMITEQSEFVDTVAELNDIVKTVHTHVEYYKILDDIEYNLLATVINISDNINPKLIKVRIDYIKTFIDKLPPICQEPGPVSEMILDLINSIIQSVSLEKVTDTINNIQHYIQDSYGTIETMETIQTIQTNLLSIIDNIGSGITSKIITVRVNYVKETLIDYL